MIGLLGKQCRQHTRSVAGVLVDADKGARSCSICGRSMRVQKTGERTAMTLAHGCFRMRQTVYVRPDVGEVAGSSAGNRRSPILFRRVALLATTSWFTSVCSAFSTTGSAKRSARRSKPSTGSFSPAARSAGLARAFWLTSKGFIMLPLPACARHWHPMAAGRFMSTPPARTAVVRCLWPLPGGVSGCWAHGKYPPNVLTPFCLGCAKSCSASGLPAPSCGTWAAPWRKLPSRL